MKRNILLTILCCVCVAISVAAQTPPSGAQQAVPEGMAQIPAGKFWMGRTHTLWRDTLDVVPRAKLDDLPANLIHLDAFLIDKYEITNTQYAQFVEATKTRAPWHWPQGKFKAGDEKQAVYNVNWFEADAYCKWAGKRLPTEAEFEKAMRGGLDRKPYPWGYKEDAPGGGGGGRGGPGGTGAFGTGKPVAVGQFPANGYGLYDMVGNVSEWTSDWYNNNYYPFMPKVNPKGPENGLYRVVRGGGWAVGVGEEASNFYRAYSDPELRSTTIGFRCAR